MWTWLKWLSMHTHIWLQILWPYLSFSFVILISAVLLRICLQWEKNTNEPLFSAQKQHDLWGKRSWAHLTILLPCWEIWSKLHIRAKPHFSQLKQVYDITGHSKWLFCFSLHILLAQHLLHLHRTHRTSYILALGPSFWLFWPLDQNLLAYQRDSEGCALLLVFLVTNESTWCNPSITINLSLPQRMKTAALSCPTIRMGHLEWDVILGPRFRCVSSPTH